MFVLVPGGVDKAAFIESLLPALVTRLRLQNDIHPEAQRIPLRIALHAGEARLDGEQVAHFADDRLRNVLRNGGGPRGLERGAA
ncbi:hypothetical protein [Amycolatopsis japonica]|uniref:hypothetical protein n=1 Tax=Amycolatopsis japonica TaxID=208439 RepID=UPI0037FE4DC7